MTLRIAFCGPNMELTEKLAHEAKELIYGTSVDVMLMPNPIKEVSEMTRRERFEANELDWFTLWACTLRRMLLENLKENEVVISGSCGIDQLALQATWLSEQIGKAQNRLVVADATGQMQQTEQDSMINRSGAVLQVILNSTEEEVVELWDFVYVVMPASSNMSTISDELLIQYFDFVQTVPAFNGVVRLPDNEEAALDALKNEVPKWKVKLGSS